jgi:hypothetical protein
VQRREKTGWIYNWEIGAYLRQHMRVVALVVVAEGVGATAYDRVVQHA